MIVFIKKNNLMLIAILLLIIIATSALINYSIKALSPPLNRVIVLDAGHGGMDLGVEGVISGSAESDINLSITKKLEKLLVENNFEVVLTRKDENGLYGDKSPGFKMRDMKERKRIIDNASADLIVSIHCNKYPMTTVRGAQVFFEATNKSSKDFAKITQNNINILNREHTGRNLSALPGEYYILKCSSLPCAIVECGFLSNPQDDALLNNNEHQNKIAYAIFSGIIGYLAQG